MSDLARRDERWGTIRARRGRSKGEGPGAQGPGGFEQRRGRASGGPGVELETALASAGNTVL